MVSTVCTYTSTRVIRKWSGFLAVNCKQLMAASVHSEGPDSSLSRLVTGDESWFQ